MTYILATYSVFLGCEGEGQERYGLEIGLCGGFCEDNMYPAEHNVFKAKRCSIGFEASVIPRSEEE